MKLVVLATSMTMIQDTVKAALTLKHPEYYLFFTTTANGRRSASEFLKRLKKRAKDRDIPVSISAFMPARFAVGGLCESPNTSNCRAA